ncbi:MAG: hypothetical protein GXO05_03395, partial [Aquificae bacterium]|nr:hypothetical protein [Aquificota bacterium]
MPKMTLKIFLYSLIVLSAGCAGFLPSSGPSKQDIQNADKYILTLDVNYKKALELKNTQRNKFPIKELKTNKNKTDIKYEGNI